MDMMPEPKKGRMSFAQTRLDAHEAWEKLIEKSPLAGRVMHKLVAKVGEHNAVVISQRTLADLLNCSERGLRDALTVLRRQRWIEMRQIGSRGTVNAYIINDRVAWLGPRGNMHKVSLFSATVIVSADEQPDQEDLGELAPLRLVPVLYPNEVQLPSGNGLPPPSEPSLPGMVPDLPVVVREDAAEPAEINALIDGLATSWRIE